MIQLIPAEHDYVYSKQLVFAVIRPVPRVFWPSKPVDPGFDLPAIIGMKGVSLSTSILGEWYISYGWIALLIRRLAARPPGAVGEPAPRARAAGSQPDRRSRWRS